MAKVRVKRGSEGPEHDPYSFTEITFYFTDKSRKPITIHRGLGDWVKRGERGSSKIINKYLGLEDPAEIFELLTGLSVRRAEAIPDMLFERSMRKYSRAERENIMECIEADEAMLRNAY
jgi:hypothetical protein